MFLLKISNDIKFYNVVFPSSNQQQLGIVSNLIIPNKSIIKLICTYFENFYKFTEGLNN